jgi:hypothetical protein
MTSRHVIFRLLGRGVAEMAERRSVEQNIRTDPANKNLKLNDIVVELVHYSHEMAVAPTLSNWCTEAYTGPLVTRTLTSTRDARTHTRTKTRFGSTVTVTNVDPGTTRTETTIGPHPDFSQANIWVPCGGNDTATPPWAAPVG